MQFWKGGKYFYKSAKEEQKEKPSDRISYNPNCFYVCEGR